MRGAFAHNGRMVLPCRTLWRSAALVRIGLLAAVLSALAGCADTRYYWQSVRGHLALMQAARPVDDWLRDPQTPEDLRTRLALSQQIRRFAVEELALPDNASYRRYADLRRSSVVWNVVAAPPYALTLQTWCFPVLGCVGYRGYFDEAQARAQADLLQSQGLEVAVYGVPAYSTLGWMNWAGGDPLLNTFIRYPEVELARLIFHELAHQVLYVADDTEFNESFATAVEQLGSVRWLALRGGAPVRRDAEEADTRRRQFRQLALATRARLQAIYEAGARAPGDPVLQARMAADKGAALADFRADYRRLRESWGGFAGYDSWVAQANNASFAVQAAYDGLVPGFEALFLREGQDWRAFYDAVRRLAERPADERRRALSTTGNSTGTQHGG